MKLEALILKLRPRLRYEAIDTGMLMARRWWLPLTTMCALPAILVVLACWFMFNNVWVAMLVLWWLKPVYERLPLWYLSRAVFGETPSTGSLWKVLPGAILPQIILTLTTRRFSTSRSFDMPVVLLEGLAGKPRQRRIQVLHSNQSGSAAFWLTIFLVHIEMILQFSLVGMLYLLLPEKSGTDFWTMTENTSLQLISYTAALLLVMPFYVAGGFALYLNQRIHLEGWELELVFRRLAGRLAPPERHPANIAPAFIPVLGPLLACILGLGGMGATSTVQAEDSKEPSSFSLLPSQTLQEPITSAEAAGQHIRGILNEPEFNQVETYRVPKFLHEWDSESDEADAEGMLALIQKWAERLASLFEWIIWMLVATLAGLLIFRYKRQILGVAARFRSKSHTNKADDRVLSDMTRSLGAGEGKPGDIIQSLWQAQRHREAFALLYQSGVRQLLQLTGKTIPDGATESELLLLANAYAPDHFQPGFRQLVRSWQALAYADQTPDDALFTTLFGTFVTGEMPERKP